MKKGDRFANLMFRQLGWKSSTQVLKIKMKKMLSVSANFTFPPKDLSNLLLGSRNVTVLLTLPSSPPTISHGAR